MKPKFSKNNLHNFLKIFLFLGIITIIAYLLPNQDTFKYQFETGKPWSYDLITSSFDFPIYKSETQIQQEKRNILQNFVPYYKLDTTVLHEQYNRLKKDYYEKHGEEPKYEKILWNTFKSIYQKGIVSAEQHQKIQEETTSQINCILPNKVIHIVSTDDIFSRPARRKITGSILPATLRFAGNHGTVGNFKHGRPHFPAFGIVGGNLISLRRIASVQRFHFYLSRIGI